MTNTTCPSPPTTCLIPAPGTSPTLPPGTGSAVLLPSTPAAAAPDAVDAFVAAWVTVTALGVIAVVLLIWRLTPVLQTVAAKDPKQLPATICAIGGLLGRHRR